MTVQSIEQPTKNINQDDPSLVGPDATATFESIDNPSNPTAHAGSENLVATPRTPALDEEEEVEDDPDEDDELEDEDDDLEDDEDDDDDLEDEDDDLEDDDDEDDDDEDEDEEEEDEKDV